MEEVAGIKEMFQMMDVHNSGKITLEELKVGLHKIGQNIPDSDVQILMEAVRILPYYYSFTFNFLVCSCRIL